MEVFRQEIDIAIDMATVKAFNFNSVHSVKVIKLKQVVTKKTAMSEYKRDTASDSNQMPLNMFPKRSMAELTENKNEKVILCTYNNSLSSTRCM